MLLTVLIMLGTYAMHAQIIQIDRGISSTVSRVVDGDPSFVRDSRRQGSTYGVTLGYRPFRNGRHVTYLSFMSMSVQIQVHLEDELHPYPHGERYIISGAPRADTRLFGIGYAYTLGGGDRRWIVEPSVHIHLQNTTRKRNGGFSTGQYNPDRRIYEQLFDDISTGRQFMPAIGCSAGLRIIAGLSVQVSMHYRYAYRAVATGDLRYVIEPTPFVGTFDREATYENTTSGLYGSLSLRYDLQYASLLP